MTRTVLIVMAMVVLAKVFHNIEIVPVSQTKNLASRARTARQEGVGGRNAEPSERSPQSPAALLVQSRTQQKSFFSFQKKKSGSRKLGKAKKTFLLGGER